MEAQENPHKEAIRQLLRQLPVREHFVAVVEEETIEWFEDHKWFTLPDDYRWFLRHLGHGGVGFETLGMEKISTHLHLFHAMREAQQLWEFIPLRDFLVIQHLADGDFYFIETSHVRRARDTAPVFRWVEESQAAESAYPDFYSYFFDQLQQGVNQTAH